MQWHINRRNNNLYMTSDEYITYHIKSMQYDKLISIQSPNNEMKEDPPDLLNRKYIIIPSLNELEVNRHADIFKVLKERRTIRDFVKSKMNYQDFCTLLQYSLGQSNINSYGWGYRTYPSGGSRYPVDIYIVPQNVEGLQDLNVYRFEPSQNRLYNMEKQLKIEDIRDSTGASKHEYQNYLDCNLYIFLTSNFKRSTCKYGLLGYRLVLLEAGHMGQNISLTAEAMNYATVPLGGYYEDKINKFIGADAIGETTIYFYLVGDKK